MRPSIFKLSDEISGLTLRQFAKGFDTLTPRLCLLEQFIGVINPHFAGSVFVKGHELLALRVGERCELLFLVARPVLL